MSLRDTHKRNGELKRRLIEQERAIAELNTKRTGLEAKRNALL
jgi:hypothetical protein